MMSFIDHNIIIEVSTTVAEGFKIGVKRLDGDEQMAQIAQSRRLMIAHPEFAKCVVVQYRTERVDRLLQDLFAMGDEEQIVTRMSIMKTLIVECCNHRLTRTCSGHYQVFVAEMYLTLDGQLVEDGLLMRQNMILLQNMPCRSVYLTFFRNGSHKALVVIVLEIITIPIGIKRGKSLADNMRILLIGDTHIPLQSLCQRRA